MEKNINKKETLYKIIENKILKLLDEDPYKNGFYLPTELELVKRFSVSRHTIRKAMGNLVLRNKIVREKGKGTKKNLSSKTVKVTLNSWESLSDEMYSKGNKFSYSYKKILVEKIDDEIRKVFSLGKDVQELVCLKRIGKNEIPGVFFVSYFSPNLKLNKDKDFMKGKFSKLYDYLNKIYGIKVKFSEEEISAIMPTQEVKEILDIKSDTIPVLYRKRVVYNSEKELIEYNIGYYRGDQFSYNLKLESKQS